MESVYVGTGFINAGILVFGLLDTVRT